MTRSPIRMMLHALPVCAGLLLAPMFPTHISLGAILLGSSLAYEGFIRRVPDWQWGVALASELMWGIPLGTLSLAYLGVVLCGVALSRFVALAPWEQAEGWAMTDAIRTILIASCASALIMVFSVGVSSVLFGEGFFRDRVQLALLSGPWWQIPGACSIVVLFLRRVDVPFRRRITFSS